MNFTVNNGEENRDRLKSGIITAIVWSAILLFLFIYKITEKLPEKKEVVTRMLINFGDNRNGKGEEEPADQPGSLASEPSQKPVEEAVAVTPQKKTEVTPVLKTPEKSSKTKDKIITGNSDKTAVKSTDKNTRKTSANTVSSAKSSSSKATTANSITGNGDGKGTAAIGNLIRGRGTKPGSQGNGTGIGNAGDPLGGDGNGDSKIGIDRKLTGYIPGTMGRGGAQPSHNCSASGTINISYTVDKAGNVVSARRSGGISDPCVVSTSVSWVKQYVKAEKANTSSTGTYRITF